MSAKWRTKDGREIAFQTLSQAHLEALARALKRQPRMRMGHLIRKELLRRGLDRLLRPSYPEL